MIYRLAFAVCICFLTVTTAVAGPWLREKGSSFTSFSLSATISRDAHSTSYLEFGITPTSTVGLDIGFSRKNSGSKLAFGTLFLRRALGPTDKTNKFAYEVGIGATYGGPNREMSPHFKTGLSWGRGISVAGKGGWVTVDTAVLWDVNDSNHVTKVDSTIGLNFTDMTSGMIQLNFANQYNDTFGYFEPSLIFNPPTTDFRIQMGLITPLKEPSQTSFKLGLWREF